MADEVVAETPIGEARAPDAEVKARELGWVPKEEFRGDPEKWVDAPDYLAYGEQVLPLVRATNARLKTDIEAQRREAEALRREVAESKETMKALQEYHAEELKQAHERARTKILAEIKEARREGDVDQEIELQGRLSKMDAEGPPKPAPAKTNGSGESAENRQPEVHPEVIAWQKENPWYGNDLARTSIAQGVAMMLRRDHPDLKGRAFLDEVVKGTNRELQRLGVSGQPARTEAKVEAGRGGSGGSTGGAGGGGGKSYMDLPADAKAECDRWASDARLVGPNKLHKDAAAFRKQWAAKYWEDN